MEREIIDGINQIIETLRQDQSSNGSWNYPFETGIATDCYMIILLRVLEINDENLIIQLTKRIMSLQEKNGSWKLFHDEGEGNITATVEAYYALLYSGQYSKQDEQMKAARRFIVANGGIGKVHMLTKIMLALTGQMKWPKFFPVPLEAILLPPTFPVNFYRFSVFGRANLTPIMILADRKYSLKKANSPDLLELYVREADEEIDDSFTFRELEQWRSFYSHFQKGIQSLIGLPSHLHMLATERAKQYMLDRLEPDGTFYGFFSATFLMIFALLSLGYTKTSPLILKAVKGLKEMKCEINGLPHMQYTTATVWNTALINYALQETALPPADPMVNRANDYLLSRQHYKYGDWMIHNPSVSPGGWGFEDMNTILPDVDDTTASLRAIAKKVHTDPIIRQAWEKGIFWVLSMQNNDGGWPAFEKNTNSKLLQLLPIEKAEFILTDPASADLTGRTLEFLGTFTNIPKEHSVVQSGVNWLLKNQKRDGSWYGRWGICFIYGTWAAITGLRAVSVLPTQQSIMKGTAWLEAIQNEDGGWGESCKSDSEDTYIPLRTSTLTHTAWAVDALIAVSDKPTRTITKGVNYILDNLDNENWNTAYPAGQGMAGAFYIHYHSYRYVFPLLALSHYKNKYFG